MWGGVGGAGAPPTKNAEQAQKNAKTDDELKNRVFLKNLFFVYFGWVVSSIRDYANQSLRARDIHNHAQLGARPQRVRRVLGIHRAFFFSLSR